MRPADQLVAILDDHRSLSIMCHDYPDPDCLASAAALAWIASHTDIENVEVRYGGRISHQQNQAMVEHLGVELEPLSPGGTVDGDLVAFVDHARPGEHTVLSTSVDVDIVIDHHEYDDSLHAEFVDLRPGYGATSTILVEYIRQLAVGLPPELASILLFALHRERLDQARNPTFYEYEAAGYLLGFADRAVIKGLYSAQFSPATLETIGEAIRNREIRETRLVSWVGDTTERDALPQAADYLLNLRGVDVVLVFGLVDGEIHLSARSAEPAVGLDRVLRRLVGVDGQAGGHSDMAGGVIRIDDVDAALDDAALFETIVEPRVERFFRYTGVGTSHPSGIESG